jgi:hypothetical protein
MNGRSAPAERIEREISTSARPASARATIDRPRTGAPAHALRPMSDLVPSTTAFVHDQLNDDTFECQPERWEGNYRHYAEDWWPLLRSVQ